MISPSDLKLPLKFGSWRQSKDWSQLTTVSDIVTAEHPITIYQGPTGSGKSVTAESVLRISDKDRAVYLTGTKQLQDQLAGDFNHPTMKGRSNYACHVLGKYATADEGPCTQGWRCATKNRCEYYLAKYQAQEADIAVLNYALYLAEANYSYRSKWRWSDLVIADECHTLESWLMNFISADLTDNTFGKLSMTVPRYLRPSDYWNWGTTVIHGVRALRNESMESLGIFYDEEGALQIPPEAMKRTSEWRTYRAATATDRTLTNMLRWLNPKRITETGITENIDETWVVRKNPKSVSLLPVWVKEFAEPFFFAHAANHVLMSATILRPDVFARLLGIQEYTWVESPSIFSKENRPLYCVPVLPMGKDALAESLPKLGEIVDDLLGYYGTAKGIIHTGNYKIAQFLLARDRTGRLLGYESGGLEQALDTFRTTLAPRVLIGPSLTTGVDLPGLVKWQLIAKLPFPDLGDEQTRRRRDQDPEWYSWVTLCNVVQAYGRGVRTTSDKCETWITDKSWNFFWATQKQYMPQWFREAVTWETPLSQ